MAALEVLVARRVRASHRAHALASLPVPASRRVRVEHLVRLKVEHRLRDFALHALANAAAASATRR